MTASEAGPDPRAVAAGAAALGGVAALAVPVYYGLALAAAALAAVLWLPSVGRDREARLPRPGGRATVVGVAAIAGSWGFALLAPAPVEALRGLALAGGAVLLYGLGPRPARSGPGVA